MNWLNWQQIGSGGDSATGKGHRVLLSERTFRAKVPGGWLVQVTRFRHETTNSAEGEIDVEISEAMAMSFVPDGKHEWNAPI